MGQPSPPTAQNQKGRIGHRKKGVAVEVFGKIARYAAQPQQHFYLPVEQEHPRAQITQWQSGKGVIKGRKAALNQPKQKQS